MTTNVLEPRTAADRVRYAEAQVVGRTPSRIVLPVTRPAIQVLQDPSRFQFIYASRRWGKSTFAVSKMISRAGEATEHALTWWVAPTYRQAQGPFLLTLRALGRSGLIKPRGVSRSERRIELRTGHVFEWRSADQPDNLRGEGLHGLVVDEMAQIADATWYECLRPALSDLGGWFLGIGTPKGARGWGYVGYRRGRDPFEQRRGLKSWKFTAEDALFIPRDELEEARRTMPARAFAQEFMAEFLDGVGVVFVDVRKKPRIAPRPGEAIGIGIDWAKKVDYTWFVAVGAESGAVLDCARYQRLPYTKQVDLAIEFYRKWRSRAPNAYVVHDRTGVGEALDDLLMGTELSYGATPQFEGLTFTEASKRQLVEEAIVDFEASKLGFTSQAEVDPLNEALIREHEDFALTVGNKGKVSYGAPDGLHDDAVMATCLANRARRLVSRVPQAGISFI